MTKLQRTSYRWPTVARLGLLCLAIVSEMTPETALGQTERLELGRRLQRFEQAWETADPAARAAAVAPMTAAVRNFFALSLSAAGKQLDEAWRVVRAEAVVGELERQVIHLQLLATPHCADSSTNELTVQLKPFYKGEVDKEADSETQIQLHLKLVDAQRAVVAEHTLTLAEAKTGSQWLTGKLAEGDYQLVPEVRLGEELFQWPQATLTRVDDLENRLLRLEQSLVAAYGKMNDTLFASLSDAVVLLRAMQAGTVQEIDFPAARRLRFCEAMLEAQHEDNRDLKDSQLATCIATEASENDVWLSLAVGRKNVAVRLRAPAEAALPLPVLFLFHGAGGSENMFFETYGAGRVVEEGLKRGWLVVAPRQGLFGLSLDVKAQLDVLEGLFEIDRSQVLLLGHSMGAGQVIRETGLHPQLPLAAVALGGGGRAKQPEALQDIAWFIGAGEQDFGRSGAQQLHESLTAAQVPSIYRDYPDVEHMVIVQAAIDDVFQFLDAQLLERQNAN